MDNKIIKPKFLIEWTNNGLTELRLTTGERQSLIRYDSATKHLAEYACENNQRNLVDDLTQEAYNLTGIFWAQYEDLFSNLLLVEQNSCLDKEIHFNDFPNGAQNVINQKIADAIKKWEYCGSKDCWMDKIKEFSSYIIYMRRFFTFNKIVDSINLGLIYIDKKAVEYEWLAYTKNIDAMSRKIGVPRTNCGIAKDCEQVQMRMNRWREKTK